MRLLNRTAVIVKPNQKFVEWLHLVDPTSIDLNLADVTVDPTVYLLPDSENVEGVDLVQRHCGQIFEEQLESWWRVPDEWPRKRDVEAFTEWFDYSFHSMVLDISADPIVAD